MLDRALERFVRRLPEVDDAVAVAHEAVRGDLAVAVLKPICGHKAAVSPGRVEQLRIGAARHPDALDMVGPVAAGTVSLGKIALNAGLTDAREIRTMLDGDDVIGNLEIDAAWLEEPGGRREEEEEGFGGGAA